MLKTKKGRDILGGILVVVVLLLSHVMLTASQWGYNKIAMVCAVAMVISALILVFVLNYKNQSREEEDRQFRVTRGCKDPDDPNCTCPVCSFQNHEDL